MTEPSLVIDTGADAQSSLSSLERVPSTQNVKPQRAESCLEWDKEELKKAEENLEKAEIERARAEMELFAATSDCGFFWPARRRRRIRAKFLVKQQADRNFFKANRLYMTRSSELFFTILSNNQGEINTLSQKIDTLTHTLSATVPSAENPWESKNKQAQTQRPDELRALSAKHYGCYNRLGSAVVAKCCLTGIEGDGNKVINTHLLPRHASSHHLRELKITDVDDPRNMIFLCKNIEKAFDDQRLCFLYLDDQPGCYELKIWHSKTKDILLYEGAGQRIGDFERKWMKFEEGKTPFTRVLSLHAQCSYKKAKALRWIDEGEPEPTVYGSPLTNDLLSFRQLRLSSTSTTSPSCNWESPQLSNDA